ncbi:MAG: hypothetical protein FWG14_08280 [Peptococcaceae bacterium]|nr:hypothetical protein [Peptococcaceae bacterium]
MEKAREMGFGAVLIMGVPDYYPRLGFKRAREYNLTLEDGGVFSRPTARNRVTYGREASIKNQENP